MNTNGATVLVALLITIQSASALHCYTCDSRSGGLGCNSFLFWNIMPSTECKLNSGSGLLDTLATILPASCVKIVGKDRDGKDYVSRGCTSTAGPLGSCNGVALLKSAYDGDNVIDCYVCKEDNCNSATRVAGMTLLGLLAACVVFLF